MDEPAGWVARADAAAARVADQVVAARARAEVASRVRAELDQVRGVARSRRDEVEVMTDATGRVVDLRFGEGAFGLSSVELSRVTLETIGRACRQAGEAALEVARTGFGAGSAAVAAMAAELDRKPEGGGVDR